jgi:hypothetical protein
MLCPTLMESSTRDFIPWSKENTATAIATAQSKLARRVTRRRGTRHDYP